jgi:hypothetical protein
MSPIAIHEAGHVLVLLCQKIKVQSVCAKKQGRYCVQSILQPYEVPPSTMIFYKIAGKIA